MSIPMTQKAVAEKILAILVKELRLKPGDRVPDHQLKDKYRGHNCDAADIPVGLEYADKQGWLRYDSATDALYLTDLGSQYP